MKRSLYRGGAAVFVAAALVACSGGSPNVAPIGPARSAQHSSRHAMAWNVGMTQALATGTMLIPLTLTVNGTSGQVAVFGSTYCAPPSGANPCPNVNFTASPPQYYSSLDVPMTLSATSLNASCTAPGGSATPAPGFTPACYVVTYEGGAGPYILQGPVVSSGGSLSVPAQTSTVYFQGLTGYNVFLAYVTSISTPPAPLTPSPVPSPTDFATPTPVPTQTTPSPCPSASSDDDESACGTPTPAPTPTGCDDGEGHHHHHHHHSRRHSSHRGDDDCADS